MFAQRYQGCLAHFTSMDLYQIKCLSQCFMRFFVANNYLNKVGYFWKNHGSHQTNRQNTSFACVVLNSLEKDFWKKNKQSKSRNNLNVNSKSKAWFKNLMFSRYNEAIQGKQIFHPTYANFLNAAFFKIFQGNHRFARK